MSIGTDGEERILARYRAWNETEEIARRSHVDAGVEPRLHAEWRGLRTGVLEASLAEYREKLPDEIELTLRMATELAYRVAHTVPAYAGLEVHPSVDAALERARALRRAYAVDFVAYRAVEGWKVLIAP